DMLVMRNAQPDADAVVRVPVKSICRHKCSGDDSINRGPEVRFPLVLLDSKEQRLLLSGSFARALLGFAVSRAIALAFAVVLAFVCSAAAFAFAGVLAFTGVFFFLALG